LHAPDNVAIGNILQTVSNFVFENVDALMWGAVCDPPAFDFSYYSIVGNYPDKGGSETTPLKKRILIPCEV
jgi:hypothetical protein